MQGLKTHNQNPESSHTRIRLLEPELLAAKLHGRYEKPDYQALRYHSAPKKKPQVGSLDDIDPQMREAWEKLGIPIGEQVRGPPHNWMSATCLAEHTGLTSDACCHK